MADNYGFQSGWIRGAVEDTYGTVGSGPFPTNFNRVREGGGDGPRRTFTKQKRSAITGRGHVDRYNIHNAAAGTLDMDFDYDEMARYLYCLMGTQEETAASEPYDNCYYPASALPTMRMQVGRGGLMFTYSGVAVQSMTLAIADGDVMTASIGLVGRVEASTDSLASPAFGTYAPVKQGQLTSAVIGGVTVTSAIESLNITVNNNLREDKWPLGDSFRGQPKRIGPLEATGDITLDWTDDVFTDPDAGLLKSWRDETGSLTAAFTFNNAGAGAAEREFFIYMPNVRIGLDEDPLEPNNGPGIITPTIPFEALDGTIPAGDGAGGGAGTGLGNINGGTHAAATNAPIGFRLSSSEDSDGIYN